MKCSVCGEILTAQEEVAALGHAWTDEFDTECNNNCGETRAPETYANAIATNGDSYGTLSIDGNTVTLNAEGTITCKKSAWGAWGKWVGFRIYAPEGVDAATAIYTRPNGKASSLESVLDSGKNYASVYSDMGAYGETATYQLDWNGDGVTDLYVVIDVTNASLEHKYTAVVTEPTCTEGGYTTYTCGCGNTYVGDEVAALGHTEEEIPAVAPTFDAPGATAGVKCSVCGGVLTAPETIPALVAIATVGEERFATLQAAINAANGATVTLLKKVVLEDQVVIPYGHTVTLELAGYSISQEKSQTAHYEMILVDGNLTIQDNVGGGKITYTDTNQSAHEGASNTITNRGTLTVLSGTVENLSSATVANYGYPYAIDSSIWGKAAEVNTYIKGGKVYCASYSAMRTRGDSATEAVNFTVEGGEIVGTIEVQNASNVATGKLTVTGGKLSNSGTANVIFVFGVNGSTSMQVEITGGEFTGNVTVRDSIGAGFNKKFISGGTFNTDVSAFVAEGYCCTGTEGAYTVQAHVEEVIPAVAPSCTEIGLTAGVKCSVCGEILTAQEEVPALGHSYTEEYFKPTYDTNGYTKYTCSICGDTYIEEEEGSKLSPLVITTYPASVEADAGAPVQFFVEATGEGTVSYHWQKKNAEGNWVYTATTGQYYNTTAQRWNDLEYRCEITDEAGAVIHTEAVSFIINEPVPEELVIITPPEDVVVDKTSAPVQFFVEAQGEGTVSYHWQKKNAAGNWVYTATTGQYYNTTAQTWNDLEYRCEITDEAGAVIHTEAVSFTIEDPAPAQLIITTPPVDVVVTETGAAVEFFVEATGEGTVSYHWQKKNAEGNWVYTATTGQYYNTTAQRWNDLEYRCEITDEAGAVIHTEAVSFIINEPVPEELVIITPPEDVVVDKTSAPVQFFVEAQGEGTVSYHWQKKNAAGNWVYTATTGQYYNTTAQTWNDLEYRCEITDEAGAVIHTDPVRFLVKATINLAVTTAPAEVTAERGTAVQFFVEAQGAGTVSYHWMKKSKTSDTWVYTATTGQYYNTTAQTWNNLDYRCEITDEAGAVIYTDAVSFTIVN